MRPLIPGQACPWRPVRPGGQGHALAAQVMVVLSDNRVVSSRTGTDTEGIKPAPGFDQGQAPGFDQGTGWLWD